MAEAGLQQAGSGPNFGPGGPPGFSPGPNAGEVILSRAEAAALAALEGEEDEKHGLRRARAESGLDDQQIKVLKRRADHLSSKGYTLKGQNFTKRPLSANPDEPGLTRKTIRGKDDEDEPEPTAKAKKTKSAKETNAVVSRTVTGPDPYSCRVEGYGAVQPASDGLPEYDPERTKETNSVTVLGYMLGRGKRKKRLY